MGYELADETKLEVCLSATEASYLLDLIDKQLQQPQPFDKKSDDLITMMLQSDSKEEMNENLKAIKDKLNEALRTAILIM